MKTVFITDLHFGARDNSPSIFNFQRQFYLDLIEYIKGNDVEAVVCCGDTFDKRKMIKFNSLEFAREVLFDPLEELGVDCWWLVGNHDAPDLNSLAGNSPRMLLGEYSNLCVVDSPIHAMIGGKKTLLVPWMCRDNTNEIVDAIRSSDASLLIGHFELFGFDMYRGSPCEHGQVELSDLTKFERVISGHFHHRSTNDNVIYLGSPYEMTWGDYGDPHGFMVYDSETDAFSFVDNQHHLFHKIHYDGAPPADFTPSTYTDCFVKVMVSSEGDLVEYERFMHQLDESNPADIKIVLNYSTFEDSAITISLMENAGDEEGAETTRQISLSSLDVLYGYIDSLSETGNADLDRVKLIMAELYAEANTND